MTTQYALKKMEDRVRQAESAARLSANGLPLRSWPACAHPRQEQLDEFRAMPSRFV